MLSPELRELFMNGPPGSKGTAAKANGFVRYGGAASLYVQWRKHRWR